MTERREPREFLAGVLAALAMLVAMGGLRIASGVLSKSPNYRISP